MALSYEDDRDLRREQPIINHAEDEADGQEVFSAAGGKAILFINDEDAPATAPATQNYTSGPATQPNVR